jgi:hypothetical protein
MKHFTENPYFTTEIQADLTKKLQKANSRIRLYEQVTAHFAVTKANLK